MPHLLVVILQDSGHREACKGPKGAVERGLATEDHGEQAAARERRVHVAPQGFPCVTEIQVVRS